MENKKKKRTLKPQTLLETARWKISPEAKVKLAEMLEGKK